MLSNTCSSKRSYHPQSKLPGVLGVLLAVGRDSGGERFAAALEAVVLDREALGRGVDAPLRDLDELSPACFCVEFQPRRDW